MCWERVDIRGVYGGVWRGVVFFFKQKTAYEMLRSLVGSKMCIRDRSGPDRVRGRSARSGRGHRRARLDDQSRRPAPRRCLLYTSDAADDLPCVDLGGRRIIKQKQSTHIVYTTHPQRKQSPPTTTH